MTKDELRQLEEAISDSLKLKIKEQVYEQTLSKDKEVSGLHREIRNEIKSLSEEFKDIKEKLDAHDLVIKEIMQIYTTSSFIKKVIMWFILFVPIVAAFFAGLKYLYDFFRHTNQP